MKSTLFLTAYVLSAVSLSLAGPVSRLELATNAGKGLRLISLDEKVAPVWKSEDQILDLIRARTGFVRVLSFHKAVKSHH